MENFVHGSIYQIASSKSHGINSNFVDFSNFEFYSTSIVVSRTPMTHLLRVVHGWLGSLHGYRFSYDLE